MAGQVWSVSTSGGYMYALNLSRELRMAVQPVVKFRQFCDIKDAAHQGLHRGDTFHWNVLVMFLLKAQPWWKPTLSQRLHLRFLRVR